MTRIIKASEVKPGMEVRWEQGGITYECAVSSVGPASFGVNVMARRSAATIYNETPVTVLSEPAPPQPEEPTELGVKARVREGRFLRLREGLAGSNVWFEEGTGYRWTWDDLCEMGPVTVIPDQGWEVPDQADEWDTWEDVPEGVAVANALLWYRYRKIGGKNAAFGPTTGGEWVKTEVNLWDIPGPWTRDSDA